MFKKSIGRMVCGGILAGVATFTAAATYPKMQLNFATYISSSLPQAEVDKWWAEELKSRSDDAINIKFYWSESLGKAGELADLIGSGAIPIGATAPTYTPSRFPLTSLPSNLPFMFNDTEEAQKIGQKLINNEYIIDENARNGLRILYWQSLPEYRLLCNKKITKISDFKGLKIRSIGDYYPDMWKAVGAIGVTVMSPEVYEGLQRGSIDCAYWPGDFMVTYKLYEAGKYLIDINFGALLGWPVWVNEKTWQSWSPEVKELFEDVSKEAAKRDAEMVGEAGDEALEEMTKHLEIVHFEETEKFMSIIPDMKKNWIESMEKKGLGEAAKDIMKLYDSEK